MNLAPKTLPTILMVMYVLTSTNYWLHRDWRHGLYWMAAATLTYCITY